MGYRDRRPGRLFGVGPHAEARHVAGILREETVGGGLLLAATTVALGWANSPWSDTYHRLVTYHLGPDTWRLRLTLAEWAADGLLAVFFFVAGLELKRELLVGNLRQPRQAAVPVAAAIGGVLVPAACYLAVNAALRGGTPAGWAVPTATDIAFVLAVLAVAGRHLPPALRAFLLTLAVVDDLLAIMIIAIFYTHHLQFLPLVGSALTWALFAVLVARRTSSWALLPLAVATWALLHASGVHATVAGVALGLAVPISPDPDGGRSLSEHFEHRWRPVSAGVAVPLFAFLSAGATVGGPRGLVDALTDPVAVGVMVGLVVGKPLGILAATWLVARYTRAHLAEGIAWTDVAAVAVLAGIGFTVCLLIAELAFGVDSTREHHATVAVLVGSLAAAAVAAVLLRLRTRTHLRHR